MNKPANILRLLIIEDNVERVNLFRAWCPPEIRVVTATTAGRAIGILRRDAGRVYAGILLDHDLQEQTTLPSDASLSTSDVLDVLIQNTSIDVPIFVHSMNLQCAPAMVTKLESAGFFVTRIPMDHLTQENFLPWLEEVRDWWET